MGLSPEQAIVLATLARAAGADVDLAAAQGDSGLSAEAFEGALKALCARGLARWAADRCFTTRAGMQAHAELPPRPDPRANTPHRQKEPQRHGATRLFISCAPQDDQLRADLETHLALLERLEMLATSTDRDVAAGEDWRKARSEKLESADILLLLVSAHLIESDYLWGVEMKRAMELHEAGAAQVIPILVRACQWRGAPFAKLDALPRNGEPVSTWARPDEAWAQIAEEIRKVVVKADRTTCRP